MDYFIVGSVCFMVGAFAGAFMMGLCAAAHDSSNDDSCDGCFGAANNDCQQCPKRKGD